MSDIKDEASIWTRGAHEHETCVISDDPERGHDHYCEMESENCEDFECVREYGMSRSSREILAGKA